MYVTAAIFDMDGTILDSSPMWREAAPRVVRQFGGTPKDSLARDVRPLGMREYVPFLREDYGLDGPVEEMERALEEFVGDYYRNRAGLKPGALDFLRSLKDKGIPLALATATDRDFLLPAMERTGALPLFDAVVTCSEAGAGKGSPAVFREAARRLNADKAGAWVFEDTLRAIRTAKADGFPVCAVEDINAAEERETIRALADRYLTDFRDFDFL